MTNASIQEIPFVVRLLPNNVLKAAYRIHLLPEALEDLQLRVGDICCIIGEDGLHGAAIAWRATDKMGTSPKVQPAKISETFSDTFGFKQGTQVRIEKHIENIIPPAAMINLIEVTPDDWERQEDNLWKHRCKHTLSQCEALAVGMSFNVHATDRIKKRFYIENIDGTAHADMPRLYRVDDDSQIKLGDGVASPSLSTTAPQQRPFHLEAAYIGGLLQQVQQLNDQLQILCTKARSGDRALASNSGILIHGFEGTGKTMLLNALSKVSGFKKVFRLEPSHLNSTAAKNEAVLNNIFDQALSTQPSLILIDCLDEITPQGDALSMSLANNLGHALDRTRGTEVLVIATARSKYKVNVRLQSHGRLTEDIELSVPDKAGRADILATMLSHCLDRAVTDTVAANTHGYTGHDLARLVEKAYNYALVRYHRDQESWHSADYSVSTPRPSTSSSSVNGRTGSVATTLVERPSAPDILPSKAELEHAMQVVLPSAIQELIVEPPDISFVDIGGSDELHARFDRLIKWPMLRPDLFGSKHKSRRGVLLYGPPGCSKTMTAQAVAKTYGLSFIAIRGAELISMYVGESERALREIFRKARQVSPAIIFFDEIDSIATSRFGAGERSQGLNVLTTLLNEMDGFEAMKDVMVLAATNRPDILDPALLRSGRFDEHIYLGPPNEQARRAIVDICIKEGTTQPDIDINAIVAETNGMSGAELRNAWQQGTEKAIERAYLHDLELKVNTKDVLAGIAATPRSITSDMLAGYDEFAQKGAARLN